MCVCVCVTWLTQSTALLNSRLRSFRPSDSAISCLFLFSQSSAWNSDLKRAATESTTKRRTRPRASRSRARWDRHAWRDSWRNTGRPISGQIDPVRPSRTQKDPAGLTRSAACSMYTWSLKLRPLMSSGGTSGRSLDCSEISCWRRFIGNWSSVQIYRTPEDRRGTPEDRTGTPEDMGGTPVDNDMSAWVH
ncbi:unnamed protein product [Ophioblennius macclurei]